jgi:hypothetical protein
VATFSHGGGVGQHVALSHVDSAPLQFLNWLSPESGQPAKPAQGAGALQQSSVVHVFTFPTHVTLLPLFRDGSAHLSKALHVAGALQQVAGSHVDSAPMQFLLLPTTPLSLRPMFRDG